MPYNSDVAHKLMVSHFTVNHMTERCFRLLSYPPHPTPCTFCAQLILIFTYQNVEVATTFITFIIIIIGSSFCFRVPLCVQGFLLGHCVTKSKPTRNQPYSIIMTCNKPLVKVTNLICSLRTTGRHTDWPYMCRRVCGYGQITIGWQNRQITRQNEQ